MEPAPDVDGAAKASSLYAKYGTRVDRESAPELLAVRAASAEETEPSTRKAKRPPKAKPPSDPLTDFLNSRQGRTLEREIVRGLFGLLKKRL